MNSAVAVIADWRRFPVRETVSGGAIAPETITVTWSDGRVSPFHFPWLRDNCACTECVHTLTREQMFEVVDMPLDLTPVTAEAVDGGLSVAWSDGHRSFYEPGWLRAHAYDDASRAERQQAAPRPLTAPVDSIRTFEHDAIVGDDGVFLEWLRAVRDIGLTLVRGVPVTPGAVAAFAERISFIRQTNFGTVFDVASKPKPDSSAYTAINLPPHTDLPTREMQPGVQFLHCLANETTGGDSIFVDGFAIAAALRERFPEDFQILTTTPVPFWNRDSVTDYRWSAPIIALDANGVITEVRYANFLRGPFDVPVVAMAGLYRAYRRFLELGRDPAFRTVRRLQPGDLWAFDNRRILHARTAFDPQTGLRHLQGCYIDRDELHSRIRLLERSRL